jgi:CubicO group peptidase (beta-lactamase class C family)
MQRKFLASTIIILAMMACSSDREKLPIAPKIQAVENGLVEFVPGPQGQAPAPRKMALPDRMAFHKVPGLSIAVINDNTVEWAKAYGSLDAETGKPVTAESIFQAASTSKLLTAVLVLHFAERRKLDLDADVNLYLKSWKIPDNDFTREKKVTLRLLLSHQSGLPMTNFGHDEKAGIPTLIQVLNNESPARNKPAVVEFVPGSRWQYSNIGYDVLQLFLQDISGRSFATIARETLFEPLGMNSSTFEYPLTPALHPREARPHDDQGVAREPSLPPTALAHGGLMTTPSDLARFTIEQMRAYQGKSSLVLSQSMTHKLFHKELDLDPKLFGFPIGEGLGVFLQGEGDSLMFAHPGSNLPGTTCWLQGYPGLGKGAVIMANGANGDLLSLEVLSALTDVYNWPRPMPPSS